MCVNGGAIPGTFENHIWFAVSIGRVVNVKFSELRDAFEFVSAGALTESTAYISRESDKNSWCGDYVDDQEDLPFQLER